MLIFSDWIIKTDGDLIARQYDNLTRELLVMGDLPEGWAWELLVQASGSVNVIALAPREEGVGVTLTADMLTKAGPYTLQLRGGRGEEVRHTNVIQVVVPASLVGDATWPELPSEFSQAEANIRALNAHPPIPGDNGYWLLWDLEAEDYVESQLPLPEVSVGPQGPEGKAASIRVGSVLTGDPGAQAAVSNSGTENDAILDFVLPRGQIGPTGPSGADGRDGKDGTPGAAATIQVGAVTTGEPGTQAKVVNVGTENAAVLQFTIPQGRPGADGMNGKDGQDGAPGPAGVGVPEISDGDEGKVMTARNGYAVWETFRGGASNPVLLTGFQPDPDDPFMMTQILALTDQQFEAVQAAFKAGQPVNVKNVYLCYPSWDRTESIEFSSGTLGSSPLLGMFANLSVGQEDKTARLKQAPTTVEPMFLTSFDGPGSVDDTMLAAFAAQAYRTYVPLSIHVKTENHVLYPSSDTGEVYEYANFHYRLTSNPELGILTLTAR